MPRKSRQEKPAFGEDFQSGWAIGRALGGEFREAVFERDGDVFDAFDLQLMFDGGQALKFGQMFNQDGSEDWKWKRLWREGNVEAQSIPDSEEAIYDENDLKGATYKCMVYLNPKTGYLDVFDVLDPAADEKRVKRMDERFKKHYRPGTMP